MTAIAGRTEDAASTRRGILWILSAIVLFVVMDTTAKHLSQSYPVTQIVWARYAFHVVLLALVLGPRLRATARTGRLGLQLFRSLMLLGTTGFIYAALRRLPLADATAIMFLTPILVTALSVPLLREQVGPRRWAGVAIGFLGAMIVIRPGAGTMQAAALLALLSASFNALYYISTRLLARTDGPMTTLLYSAAVGAVAMSAVQPFVWTPPDLEGWALMVFLGTLGGISHFALIKAFHAAPASVLAPFNYTSIVWATLSGFLLFADLPDRWTVTGAFLIIASGLYIFYRERVRRTGAG